VLHHLGDVHLRGVHAKDSRSRPQRRQRTFGIRLVARPDLCFEAGCLNPEPFCLVFQQTSLGASLEIGGEENSDRCIREHHGGHVPAFGHQSASRSKLSLTAGEVVPDTLELGDARGHQGHLRLPQFLVQLPVADEDMQRPVIKGEPDRLLFQLLRQGGFVGRIKPFCLNQPGHRPVHGSGIKIDVAQPCCQQPAHGALARPCGAVHGNDHPAVQFDPCSW